MGLKERSLWCDKFIFIYNFVIFEKVILPDSTKQQFAQGFEW